MVNLLHVTRLIHSYENFCPTDFSAPIFTKYFWDFCKSYKSNIPLNGVPTITGIPIVATYSPSASPKPNSTARSYFPSAGYTAVQYQSGWLVLGGSFVIALMGVLIL